MKITTTTLFQISKNTIERTIDETNVNIGRQKLPFRERERDRDRGVFFDCKQFIQAHPGLPITAVLTPDLICLDR
jgi:hypothetical protein